MGKVATGESHAWSCRVGVVCSHFGSGGKVLLARVAVSRVLLVTAVVVLIAASSKVTVTVAEAIIGAATESAIQELQIIF